MQLYVPDVVGVYSSSENQEGRLPVTRSCQKCKKVCDKLLQLPECGHQFCRQCLSRCSSRTNEPDFFFCPECGERVSRPDKLKKPSRASSSKTKTKFYTNELDMGPEQAEVENASDFIEENATGKSVSRHKKAMRSAFTKSEPVQLNTGKDVVKVREKSIYNKSKSLHRTAVRFSNYKCSEGFNSRISSDGKDCLYFGGDIMPNGDIILADWLNCSLKVFESSGQFVCSTKLKEAPLDVTVVRDDMIVVSFGSTCRNVLFLTYVRSSLVLDQLSFDPFPGFLYSMTKYEDSCVGIYEREGKSPSIVQIKMETSRRKSGTSRRKLTDFITTGSSTDISSESGIFYNHKDCRLYVTSRRRLLCFNKDRKLIFEKRYQCAGADMYFLGSVTCDVKEVTYVASDNCILRLNRDGDLISVVPTQEDPYHILTRSDQSILVVTGTECRIVRYKVDHKR